MIEAKQTGIPKIIDLALVLPKTSKTVELLYKNPDLSDQVQELLIHLNPNPHSLDRSDHPEDPEEDLLAVATSSITERYTPLYRRVVWGGEELISKPNLEFITIKYFKIGDLGREDSIKLINIWNVRYGNDVVNTVLSDLVAAHDPSRSKRRV